MASTDFAENRRRMVDRDIARARNHRCRECSRPWARFRARPSCPKTCWNTPTTTRRCRSAKGQTISQPYIVALMMETAGVKAGRPGAGDRHGLRLLDRGTGGDGAARFSPSTGTPIWSGRPRKGCGGWGTRSINLRSGDGTLGWPEEAPFDAIIVTAGGPEIPDTLSRQLKTGGRLVIPVGQEERFQRLMVRRRTGEDSFEDEDLGSVAFVPLIGAHGWKREMRSRPIRLI